MAGFDWVGPAASCHLFKMILSRGSDGVDAWADPRMAQRQYDIVEK
jgi:hypothetical protein